MSAPVSKARTPGLYATRGMTQMCDPSRTTVCHVGNPDADGARWWLFSDADAIDAKETAARLALCWNSHDALVEALRELVAEYYGNPVPSADIDAMYARARAALRAAGVSA